MSGKNGSRFWKGFWLYSPVLIAVLIMLPRLFSPQFGLLDDGKSILTAQDLARGSWTFRFDTTDARVRPLYWISFAFLYNSIGARPVWFFLLNMLVLCLTISALIAFLRRQGASLWQAWLAGLFFVLSGTVIENFYTLSKGEWLQVMFIASSLFVIAGYPLSEKRSAKVLLVAGASLLLIGAMLSKETSVVMLPVSAVWAVLGYFWTRRALSKEPDWRIPYLVAAALAAGLYLFLRSIYMASAVSLSGYTERYIFVTSQILLSAVRWAGWLIRDFSFLGVLFLLVVILLIQRRKFSHLLLVIDLLIWMGAWVAVYLPWNYMAEYYMLPFSFGAAIFSGLVLGDRNVWQTMGSKLLAGFSVALFIISALTNFTTARLQLVVDAVNEQMLQTISRLPPGSKILINIQLANEYTDEIKMQLEARFQRGDLSVELFDPRHGLPDSCPSTPCFLVSPQVHNQPLMTVRMGLVEPTQADWNSSLQTFLDQDRKWKLVDNPVRSFRMLAIDIPRLLCSFVNTRVFCATPSPLIDRRIFTYGWYIYQLQGN